MRKKLIRKRTGKKAGSAPGTLVHIGEKAAESVRIRVMDYDGERLEETEIDAAAAAGCRRYGETPTVSWINVDGIHQTEVIEALGNAFALHPLVQEDILNTEQRPKMESYDNALFLVFKMLSYDEILDEVRTEQVSLILGPTWVLSFQEREGDVFDGVRERLRGGKGRIRRQGADYLAYALLDAAVDSYFGILEKIGDDIEELETELINAPVPATLERIHHFKREMILLRKAVWPLREVISGLQRDESDLVADTTDVYLRDVYDHTIQILDTVETFRDIIAGMLDLYLSSISNRMNEIMKVLTIIATIFIPLTFIVGVYGMNFVYIPELKWHWGYFAVWGVMLAIAGAMFVFFRRRKWL